MLKPAGISRVPLFLKWITLTTIIFIVSTSLPTEVFAFVDKPGESAKDFSTLRKSTSNGENGLPIVLVKNATSETEASVFVVNAQPVSEKLVVRDELIYPHLRLQVVEVAASTYTITFDIRDRFFKRASVHRNRKQESQSLAAVQLRHDMAELYRENHQVSADAPENSRQLLVFKQFQKLPKIQILLC